MEEELKKLFDAIMRKIGTAQDAPNPQVNPHIVSEQGLGLSSGLIDSLGAIAGRPASIDTLTDREATGFAPLLGTMDHLEDQILINAQTGRKNRHLVGDADPEEVLIHEFGHKFLRGAPKGFRDQKDTHVGSEERANRFTRQFFELSGRRPQSNNIFAERLPEEVTEDEMRMKQLIMLRLGRMEKR